MKRSKAETAETRRRIVDVAAAEFRQNGIQATGLADIMAAAGLTHGGFYRHFDSKNQLIAEASVIGLDAVIRSAKAAGDDHKPGKENLAAILAAYLSTAHRDSRSEGCPLAALGSELARADQDTRTAVSSEVLRLVDVLAEQFPRAKDDTARGHAMFALAAMVGAVTLSRLVSDREVSSLILRETRNHLIDS